jgi:hypothetical protein
MGKYAILFLMAFQSAVAGPSTAQQGPDSVQLDNETGKTTITLNGADTSAAAEIYAVLDKAGAPQVITPAGRSLNGDLVSASVNYLRGEHFGAALVIAQPESTYGILPYRCAPANACAGQTARLLLGGKVAQELYEAMQKASFPSGNLLGCTQIPLADGSTYHCSLAIPAQ